MDALLFAFAHPGHGLIDAASLWHYVTEPVHALGILAGVALAGGLAFVRLRRRRPQ